jgi:hypothetical protein
LPLLKNVRKALERIAGGEVVEVIEIRLWWNFIANQVMFCVLFQQSNAITLYHLQNRDRPLQSPPKRSPKNHDSQEQRSPHPVSSSQKTIASSNLIPTKSDHPLIFTTSDHLKITNHRNSDRHTANPLTDR